MTCKDIKDFCDIYFGYDIAKKSRRRHFIDARNAYYKICQKYTYYTLENIGDQVQRNHASVINGLGKINNYLERYGDNDKSVMVFKSIEKTFLETFKYRNFRETTESRLIRKEMYINILYGRIDKLIASHRDISNRYNNLLEINVDN